MEHRLTVKREFAGSYISCCGIQIERSALGGWVITWPGMPSPDEWARTLEDAKWVAEQHHTAGK